MVERFFTKILSQSDTPDKYISHRWLIYWLSWGDLGICGTD